MPGFDEHEKHSGRDKSWQAADAARLDLPCTASSSLPLSEQQLAARGIATNTLSPGSFSCSAGLAVGGPHWFPDVSSAAELDFVQSQYCSPQFHSDPAMATCPTEQPHISMHYASASASEQYPVGSDMYVHPYSTLPYAAAWEANSFHLNSRWDPSSHPSQYTVAEGWPITEPTAAVHFTSSALVSTQPAPGNGQTQATALPVQQQLQGHPSLADAAPHLTNDTQEDSDLWLQTSCSSGTVPAPMAFPCVGLGDKRRPAATDIAAAEQTSEPARDAYCQVNTEVHMLAESAAHQDSSERVAPGSTGLNLLL
ncbi:hypothetical protein ABBQ38_009948 [Trebouxia sp. C0009 RCD-2024]